MCLNLPTTNYIEVLWSGDPHGSYFAPGNVAVQCDIVAATILGKPVEAVSPAAAVEVVPTTPEVPNQK